MKTIISLLLLIVITSGCASITPESVIDGHKAKREVVLMGSVDENLEIAKKLLPICYPGVDIPLFGPPTLTSHVIDNEDYKALVLGNDVKGGTGYFEFRQFHENTLLTAYSNEWYDMDTRLFHRYVDSIVKRDGTDCR